MKKRVLLFLSVLFSIATLGQSPIEKAAKEFIVSLDAPLRQQACMSWEDAERFNWHFVPRERKGLPLRAMSVAQRGKAYDLLKLCMSADGYKKASSIVEMELVLRALEGRGDDDDYRNPGKYYFTVFGDPGAGKPWGWRMEGHHLSLNFSAADKTLISGTPGFMGANPAIVPDGPKKGLQILKEESVLGFQLLNGLDAEQLKVALVAETAPADIITGNKRTAWLQDPPGLSYSKLKPAQQQLLKKLLAVYIDRYTKLMADILWKEIETAGWDQLHFAWAGGKEWGIGHYYRIQGPTFIIEYDNTQNKANHVHTSFRDLKNDFGEDMLKQHYDKAH
ncbi:DUF3500 domain-containing protein [Chitinophaga sp. SYP-B3965]|uniref:DUF3500 domain-containing protein n=1 Tax=Chitinophaga sp. SYP-B3965 TaxID=2663120 RepID=UPI001299D6A4|nr:DUF3500 domain-containing protein [Chitinophaga sp. SYP-B3965]MRG46467.1 DUF3500 domain-containing protein [Chitinophaga sp. SYP-B3965]